MVHLAAVAAALTVMAFAIWMVARGHSCFLDVLNDAVIRGATFHPFYAGHGLGHLGVPLAGSVIPGIDVLESLYPQIKAEAEALLPLLDAVPTMQEVYNHNFMRGGKQGAQTKPSFLERAATAAIYGHHADIFDRIQTPKWRTYNLLVFDQEVPVNALRCPVTMAALRGVKGVQSALFSFMLPGAHVPPHADPGKGVIRYHLGLKVPTDRKNCFIQVEPDLGLDPEWRESVRYHWGEGSSMVWDSTFTHWVRNDTNETRIILFVDIKRPLSGVLAPALQGLADMANRSHPGVKRLLQASAVPNLPHPSHGRAEA